LGLIAVGEAAREGHECEVLFERFDKAREREGVLGERCDREVLFDEFDVSDKVCERSNTSLPIMSCSGRFFC